MRPLELLNLLIIDDNQLYAEQLIGVLEQLYYKKVNLGFLDAKDELLKSLRQSWDVLIMGKAYDLTLPQVVNILAEQGCDLPVIAILPTEQELMSLVLSPKEQVQLAVVAEGDQTDKALPLLTYWGASDALPKDRLMDMALRVHREHQQLYQRRELKQLQHILKDAEQRANILIKNSKSAVAYIEDGLHIFANEPYLQMFGFHSMDELVGVPVVDLIASNNIKDFKQFLRDFERGSRKNVEFGFESVRPDGSSFDAKLQLAAATYEGQPCVQVIIQPDDRVNSAELAKRLAMIERMDPVTQLFNRRAFEQQLLPQMREAVVKQQLGQVALLSIHIDDLGKLHTKYGIQGADAVALTLANLLKEYIAPLVGEDGDKKGYVSRFNDSHFTVMLPNVEKADVDAWSHRVIDAVKRTHVDVGNLTIKFTVSIGGTMITSHAPDVNELIDRVARAVVVAIKESNSESGYHLYDPAQFANSDDASLLEALMAALTEGKFTLLYQPIYDVADDVSNMFEVFLRLPLADGTLMTPDKFLNVANQYNLMDKIDRWVMIRACKELKRYRATVDPTARLLIHLSPRSLVDDTLSTFAGQLAKAVGTDKPGTLTLQFSEGMINDHLNVAAEQSQKLKQVGVDMGIYNFGSATNSLKVLTHVNAAMVRLDRSYIKDLGNSENIDTIASLISKVNTSGASCLMAFIEDPAAMSAAWTVGARYLQGNFLQSASDTMHIVTE